MLWMLLLLLLLLLLFDAGFDGGDDDEVGVDDAYDSIDLGPLLAQCPAFCSYPW